MNQGYHTPYQCPLHIVLTRCSSGQLLAADPGDTLSEHLLCCSSFLSLHAAQTRNTGKLMPREHPQPGTNRDWRITTLGIDVPNGS